MRVFLKILGWLAALLAAAVIALFAWLWVAPPALIRVGSAYSAKIVCSNVFIAHRDAQAVLNDDVQAPGHPLLRLMRVRVDEKGQAVTAGLFGFLGKATAVAREGLGCASVPDGDVAAARAVSLPSEPPAAPSDSLWPEGDRVAASQDPALAKILDDPAMTGPGMRAVVVARAGRIVGERYGAGFSAETPLLGWSMTKTVNAAIVGTLVAAGRMSVDASDLLTAWSADERRSITLADLMAMSSGLAFNEDYGDVTDVTRMLFLEPDMAGFAAAKPLAGETGRTWNYSSGTAVIISRLWQAAAGAQALEWPRRQLFGPLGMKSAVLETDESGTFVGSSYLYATARDWARFGQFLLQDGVWNGQRLLPPGFVNWMREPAPASGGSYGMGQLWLEGPGGPPSDPSLPADTFWLIGHDGQTVAVVPSRQLVVVRMGLTPSKYGYRPQNLVSALAATH
ncbi:MAG: serine hydrolase [Rhizobiales bacterium]|nr:serine hydrolase [Hyphomicrobiales bacterium]